MLQHISDVSYQSCSDLEALTGADLMVSPDGLPNPFTEKLIQYHVKNHAKLIQIKFGHDLAGSIVDGRLDNAMGRMQSLPSEWWQRILLFVGILSFDSSKNMATINGQLSYSDPPMTWRSVQGALIGWSEGGAIDPFLSSGKLIKDHLYLHQMHVNYIHKHGGRRKIIVAKPQKFPAEDVPQSDNEIVQEYRARQIELVEDLRTLIKSVPDARLGDVNVNSIYQYMIDNGYSLHFGGFLELLKGDKPKLLEVPGIGKKKYDGVMRGLWWTKEERNKIE
jgi:hypothetical protein